MAERQVSDSIWALHNPHEFYYEPLVGALAIRLLELHAGKSSDDIHCTIMHDSLENGKTSRDYVALSYAWGDPLFTRRIFCNGTQFYITPNLEGALRRLRQSEESRTLWIDQICIDQMNLVERGAQVQIVKNIYQGATLVVAWLGESTADTDMTIQFMGTLEENLSRNITPTLIGDSGAFFSTDELPDNPGWLALRNLFALPWFSRVWVVQEAMVARHLVLQWGSKQIAWDMMSGLVAKLQERPLLEAHVFGDPQCEHARNMIALIEDFKSCQTVTLDDLLEGFAFQRSSKPSDKIYAFLGLIKNATSYKIVPDYKIPVENLFRFVSKAMIEENQDLGILDRLHLGLTHSRTPQLPSWSPDWCFDRPGAPLPLVNIYKFKASGRVEASLC